MTTQTTDIVGLAHRTAPLAPRVHGLVDTTTPPVEEEMMAIDKFQLPAEGTPSLTKTNMENPNFSPTLFLRRNIRPQRISMPEVVPDYPRSPPPTEALMSPLPAANRLHAGHTPIVPRARSPFPEVDDEDTAGAFPDQEDSSLSGPLTLPPQPGDGTEDTIPLSRLDAELEKLRIEQEHSANPHDQVPSELNIAPNPIQAATDNGASHSSRASPTQARRRRSSAEESVEVVDGVLLKKPKYNFGAPLGQA